MIDGLHLGNCLPDRRLSSIGCGDFADAQSRRHLRSLRALQELLKVPIFREDIVERFVHHIICCSVNERGILIDLRGGALVQSD
jgi:hypothetical protein